MNKGACIPEVYNLEVKQEFFKQKKITKTKKPKTREYNLFT